MTLDEILFHLPEPERTHAMERFLASDAADNPVKLRPSKGTLKVRYKGEVVTVPPAGKWFGRRSAVDFLLAFGEQGQYVGRDMATGYTQTHLDLMEEAERQRVLARPDFRILDVYVRHIPEEEIDAPVQEG